jgi:hypothetical protein
LVLRLGGIERLFGGSMAREEEEFVVGVETVVLAGDL